MIGKLGINHLRLNEFMMIDKNLQNKIEKAIFKKRGDKPKKKLNFLKTLFRLEKEGKEASIKNIIKEMHPNFEGKIFVISVTGIFSEEMKEYLCKNEQDREQLLNDGGHSAIIGPQGDFLAGPCSGEGLIYADADFEKIIEGKMLHDMIGHYNRFDIFRLELNKRPIQSLIINGE